MARPPRPLRTLLTVERSIRPESGALHSGRDAMGKRTLTETSRNLVLRGWLIVFAISLCLGGGSSRADVFAVLFVRICALGMLATALLAGERQQFERIRTPLIFVGIIAALLTIQLIPLPPALWGALPGRELYMEVNRAIGVADVWRPLSISPDLTLNSCLALLPPVAVVVAMGVLDEAARRHIFTAILVMIFASAFLAVLQQSDGPESTLRFYHHTNRESGVGLLANRNHQALLMAIGIPVAAWWAFTTGRTHGNRPVRLVTGAALAAICLVGAALTASRSGVLLTLLGMAGALAIAWPSLDRVERRTRLALGSAFLLAGTASLIVAFPSLKRFSASAVQSDGRLATLPDVTTMLSEFFPVGIGFGAFERVFPSFERVETLSPSYLNHVHSDLIELGIEAGLPGYFLLAAFIFWWLRTSVGIWQRASPAGPGIGRARLGSIVVALCFAASLTDYPLRTPIIASIFAASAMMMHFGRSGGLPPRGV